MRLAARVPYCALAEVPELGYGETDSGNLLIRADNLMGLKALCPHYAGAVKCVFIDPPYNTRKDFEHYRDNLQHTQWLEMMYPRLELLNELLAEDGSIWAIIDDDEGHYLKVLMDEIFGRKNFVGNVVWQKKFSPQADAKWLSDSHDHIFCYAKNRQKLFRFLLPRTEEMDMRYNNPDDDPRGPWASSDITVKSYTPAYDYPITTPSGRVVHPTKGRCWMTSKERMQDIMDDNRLWFGKDNNNVPRLKKFLSQVQPGIKPMTVWLHTEVGNNQESRREAKALNEDDAFKTPKPERLIQRVLQLATQPGDLVLDSFLGSGTTAAVAHKMGRRYIGLEMENTAETHCVPRLRAVVDGEQGGISKSVKWGGGGGFRFLRLGGAVFNEDDSVNPDLTFADLAAHIWFLETHRPFAPQKKQSPFLGEHRGVGYALLYNGILGDKSAGGGNKVTTKTLATIRRAVPKGFSGKIIVYAHGCLFRAARMDDENIEFRQIPYDCKKG